MLKSLAIYAAFYLILLNIILAIKNMQIKDPKMLIDIACAAYLIQVVIKFYRTTSEEE